MSASTISDRRQESDRPEPQTRTRTDETQAEESLTDDEIFHLLQARRRRLVLHYLRGREGPVTMRDVAEQVAAWEHDTTVEALRSQERQRVYIALYQGHLPTLDEAGVIDYNKPRGTIEPTDDVHQLYPYLSDHDEETVTMERERTASNQTTYYGGASLASTGLFAASWTGLIALPLSVVAAVTTVVFTLITLGARMRSAERLAASSTQ